MDPHSQANAGGMPPRRRNASKSPIFPDRNAQQARTQPRRYTDAVPGAGRNSVLPHQGTTEQVKDSTPTPVMHSSNQQMNAAYQANAHGVRSFVPYASSDLPVKKASMVKGFGTGDQRAPPGHQRVPSGSGIVKGNSFHKQRPAGGDVTQMPQNLFPQQHQTQSIDEKGYQIQVTEPDRGHNHHHHEDLLRVGDLAVDAEDVEPQLTLQRSNILHSHAEHLQAVPPRSGSQTKMYRAQDFAKLTHDNAVMKRLTDAHQTPQQQAQDPGSFEQQKPFEVDRTPRVDEMRLGRPAQLVNSLHQTGRYQASSASSSPHRRIEPRTEQAKARQTTLQGKKPSIGYSKVSNSSQLKLKLDMGRLKKQQERANTNNTRDDIYSDGQRKETSYTFHPSGPNMNQSLEQEPRHDVPVAPFATRTFDNSARQADLSRGRASKEDYWPDDLAATSKTVTVIGAQIIPSGNSRRRGNAGSGSEHRPALPQHQRVRVIEQVQQERAVHSPAEKFASKRSNKPGGTQRRSSRVPPVNSLPGSSAKQAASSHVLMHVKSSSQTAHKRVVNRIKSNHKNQITTIASLASKEIGEASMERPPVADGLSTMHPFHRSSPSEHLSVRGLHPSGLKVYQMLSAREPEKGSLREEAFVVDEQQNSNNGDAEEEEARVDIRSMPLSGRRGGGGGGVHGLWRAADDGGSADELEQLQRVQTLRQPASKDTKQLASTQSSRHRFQRASKGNIDTMSISEPQNLNLQPSRRKKLVPHVGSVGSLDADLQHSFPQHQQSTVQYDQTRVRRRGVGQGKQGVKKLGARQKLIVESQKPKKEEDMEDDDGEEDEHAFYGEEAPDVDLWDLEADDAPMHYYDEILGSSDPQKTAAAIGRRKRRVSHLRKQVGVSKLLSQLGLNAEGLLSGTFPQVPRHADAGKGQPMSTSVFDRQAAWARRRPEDQLDSNLARGGHDGDEPGVREITDTDELRPAQFEITAKRMDALYEEIYLESREQSSGTFFGFFSGQQDVKTVGCLRMDAATQPQLRRLAQENYDIAECCFPLNDRLTLGVDGLLQNLQKDAGQINYTDLEHHRTMHRLGVEDRKRKYADLPDHMPEDPLDALWIQLCEQDDELICRDSCQLSSGEVPYLNQHVSGVHGKGSSQYFYHSQSMRSESLYQSVAETSRTVSSNQGFAPTGRNMHRPDIPITTSQRKAAANKIPPLNLTASQSQVDQVPTAAFQSNAAFASQRLVSGVNSVHPSAQLTSRQMNQLQAKAVNFDMLPSMHNLAEQLRKMLLSAPKARQLTHQILCHHKFKYLQEFMRVKARHQRYIDEVQSYHLQNSIIPAIQGHVLISLGFGAARGGISNSERELLLDTSLSCQNVLTTYLTASRYVDNWTQAIDFGPFVQEPPYNVQTGKYDDAIGVCQHRELSTEEFAELRVAQIDRSLSDPSIENQLFNPLNCMMHVDLMGNLLSNMKLAFYESKAEQNFFSKMISDGNENQARENLVRAYEEIRQIYDDMLAPYRWSQLGHIRQLNEMDTADVLSLGAQLDALDLTQVPDESMKARRNLDLYFEKMHPINHARINDATPLVKGAASNRDLALTFYHSHIDRVATTWFFNMSPQQYLKTLQGIPYDKTLGGENSQILLRQKIQLLKSRLKMNESDLETINAINFLSSKKYNIDVFGVFNPLLIDEEDILIKLQMCRQ